MTFILISRSPLKNSVLSGFRVFVQLICRDYFIDSIDYPAKIHDGAALNLTIRELVRFRRSVEEQPLHRGPDDERLSRIEADEVRKLLVALSQRDVAGLDGAALWHPDQRTLGLDLWRCDRTVPEHPQRQGIDNVTFEIPANYHSEVAALQASYEQTGKTISPETSLFLSRKGSNKAITRQQASEVITAAAKLANLDGKVNTHSARKTFCDAVSTR